MIRKDHIIVLRSIRQGERNLVVTCYSRTGGKEAIFLKNVGKNIRPYIYPLSVLECTLSGTRKNGLSTAYELTPVFQTASLRNDVYKYAMSQYMAELIYRTTEDLNPDPEMYRMITMEAKLLNDLAMGYANLHLHFTVDYISHLGYRPVDNWSEETPYFAIEESKFINSPPNAYNIMPYRLSLLMHYFCSRTQEQILMTAASAYERAEFLRWMVKYISFHSSKNIQIVSLEVITDIFTN